MKNCKKLLSGLLFLLSGSLAAATTCPTPEEWHGIKTRAFFNKLAVGALYCKSYKPDLTAKYEEAHSKLTVTSYRTYYISQIDLANKYYDRVDGITRPPLAIGAPRTEKTYGQNRNWDRDETARLNTLSLQAIKEREKNGTLDVYCEENYKAINDVIATTSSEQVDALAIAHPYSQQHGLTACDATGEIAMPSPVVSSPATVTTADQTEVADTSVVRATNTRTVPQNTAVLRSLQNLMVPPPINSASCDESQRTTYPASCDATSASDDN